MSENNTQKIITDVIFKSAIEKILTEISDYIYVEEPYTKPEIDDMFDATSQEIDYYSSLINDGMISENRLWSAKKISEELAKSILESNAYTDGLLSNLSSIELKYVTSLPIDNISSNTIYILKSSLETEPDTLNLYDGTQWTEIGKFEFDMSGYVTTDDMNTELGKKANDNEVVKVSNILTDTTGASNNNVLSASATVTELDKKVNKTDIEDNLTSTNTDKPLSANQGKVLNDGKIDKTSIATTISNTPSDGKVASEKAIKTELDKKADRINIQEVKTASGQAKYLAMDIPRSHSESGKLTRLFISDNGVGIGLQIWDDSGIEKEFRTVLISNKHLYIAPKTLTPASTKVNFDSSIYYTVVNGMCYVNLWGINITSDLSMETIIDNLPKAKVPVSFTLVDRMGSKVVGLGWIDVGKEVIYCNAKLEAEGTTSRGYARFSYPVDINWIPS